LALLSQAEVGGLVVDTGMRRWWAAGLMLLSAAVLAGSCVDGMPVVPPGATLTAASTATEADPWGCRAAGTRLVELSETVAVFETMVPPLAQTAAALWDGCYLGMTATAAVLSPTARDGVPAATCSAAPAATEMITCRRCLPNNATWACPEGYTCRECATCQWRCVRLASPNGDCNWCVNLGLP